MSELLLPEEIDELADRAAPIDLQGLNFQSDGDGPIMCQGVDKGKMSAKFTLVTTQVNRQGNAHVLHETEQGKGMITTEHQQNPVVFFEHGHGTGIRFPAIGQSRTPGGEYTVKTMKSKATGEVYFSQSNPDAAIIFAMVDDGTLGMASIGFKGLKGVRMKQRQAPRLAEGVEELAWEPRGIIFTETMLREWSIVAAGADLGAMAQSLSRGTYGAEKQKLTDTMSRFFQSLVGDAGKRRSFVGWEPEPGTDDASGDATGEQSDAVAVVPKGKGYEVYKEIGRIQYGRVKLQGQKRDVESLMNALVEQADIDNGGSGEVLRLADRSFGVVIEGHEIQAKAAAEILMNHQGCSAYQDDETKSLIQSISKNRVDTKPQAEEIPFPNLAERLKEREQSQQQTEMMAAISQTLTDSLGKMIDEKIDGLAAQIKKTEDDLKRRTGA